MLTASMPAASSQYSFSISNASIADLVAGSENVGVPTPVVFPPLAAVGGVHTAGVPALLHGGAAGPPDLREEPAGHRQLRDHLRTDPDELLLVVRGVELVGAERVVLAVPGDEVLLLGRRVLGGVPVIDAPVDAQSADVADVIDVLDL